MIPDEKWDLDTIQWWSFLHSGKITVDWTHERYHTLLLGFLRDMARLGIVGVV
jgi:hypothetical protein